MIRILGIDPGMANVGWGVVVKTNGNVKWVGSGLITTSPKNPEEQRLEQIALHLRDIIKELQPKILVYEKTFFNKPTMVQVYKTTGAVLLTAAQMGLMTASYQPQQVKQAVSGSRSADKRHMKIYVSAILRQEELNGASEHEVDALAVAITRAHRGWYEEIKEKVYSG